MRAISFSNAARPIVVAQVYRGKLVKIPLPALHLQQPQRRPQRFLGVTCPRCGGDATFEEDVPGPAVSGGADVVSTLAATTGIGGGVVGTLASGTVLYASLVCFIIGFPLLILCGIGVIPIRTGLVPNQTEFCFHERSACHSETNRFFAPAYKKP